MIPSVFGTVTGANIVKLWINILLHFNIINKQNLVNRLKFENRMVKPGCFLPAVDRVNMPRRRIQESEIGDLDTIRMHNLNQIRSCVF